MGVGGMDKGNTDVLSSCSYLCIGFWIFFHFSQYAKFSKIHPYLSRQWFLDWDFFVHLSEYYTSIKPVTLSLICCMYQLLKYSIRTWWVMSTCVLDLQHFISPNLFSPMSSQNSSISNVQCVQNWFNVNYLQQLFPKWEPPGGNKAFFTCRRKMGWHQIWWIGFNTK